MAGVVIPMRRIGIGVGADSVCAAVTRGGEVEWSDVDTTDNGGVEAALTRLLTRLPSESWPKSRVHAAVASDYSYVKTIRALPSTRDERALGQIVAASPSRFFILTPGAFTVTGVRVLESGVVRAAVVDNEVIDAIKSACTATGWRLARITPAEVALSGLLPEERADPCALGLGAIQVDKRETVVIQSRRLELPNRSIGGLRIALAAAVAFCAVVGALTLPTLTMNRRTKIARAEIATLSARRSRAVTGERQLTETAQMLSAVSAFERERVSTTFLLEQLANALPATAAIVSLNADSAAVTLRVLGSHADEVVRAIHEMPGASRVEVIGAITYDGTTANAGVNTDPRTTAVDGMERVTVRFRLLPEPATVRTSFVSDAGAKK